ncbi:hypothetical protein CVT24_002298 [Panaeolus cyanescens]|uniref:LamG-like jellyroll fold domain-containing protein n=1 Tax=Panaeolus cyanescens TaxID=181874 RepID=A0A409YIQ3_9AGAR|nr:hypothetical protein CVT24_002298 [Panaeolus cyanescens]
MSWDMRIPALLSTRMVLLSNWKKDMWQFISFLDPDGRVGLHTRRNMHTSGSDPDQGLVDVLTASAIPIGQWVNIAFSFDRTKRTLYVYVNGKRSNESVVRSSVTDLTLHTSNATHFQFGLQADTFTGNGTMNADIRNLRFFKLFTSTQ